MAAPMNGLDFAKSIGVAYGTVMRWLYEGMPAKRGKPVEIDPDVAKAWIEERYPKSIARHRTSVVYFARRGSDGAVKIGFTSDPERRMRELRKKSRSTVQILAIFPGAKPDELRLHAKFAAHRLPDGEWFAGTKDVLDFVKGLGRSAA